MSKRYTINIYTPRVAHNQKTWDRVAPFLRDPKGMAEEDLQDMCGKNRGFVKYLIRANYIKEIT